MGKRANYKETAEQILKMLKENLVSIAHCATRSSCIKMIQNN